MFSIRHILLTLCAALTLAGAAQNTTSPYSRFGYGLLSDNASSAQLQMGGTGYAMRSGRQINVMNPASYAAIDSLTFLFDIGATGTRVGRREGAAREAQWGGGLDYVTMQWPLGKRLGMSVGLLPYSSVGYSFGSKIENGSSSHEGTGGINQLYAGVAGRIVDGLTVGVNVGYLFGTTYNDVYANLTSSSRALFEQVVQVRDFQIQAGIQYGFDFGPARDHRLDLGVTYTPGKSFLGHTWVQKYDVGTQEAPDTLAGSYVSLKGRYTRPETWGAGIAYSWQKRLTIEADFTYQPWSNAKLNAMEGVDGDNGNINFTATRFANRYKGAVGASFIPSLRGGYLQRITYRLGAHYTRDYVMVSDNNMREYGISLGFGLPTPSSKTVVNLGFEWLHRYTSPVNLLTENYFNIRLGINFNQLWFMQSKIN